MKSRVLGTILVSLVLAAVAAWVANNWISSRVGTQQVATNMSPVVVAAANIPAGSKVEATQLKVVQLPTDAVPQGSYAKPQELVGQVAQQSVYAGEIILKTRIAQSPPGSPLAALIPKGKRAITIPVNVVAGVAGFVLPGSRVDILANTGGQPKTILQDMKVLAINQSTKADKDEAVVVSAVTLEVTPVQAEIVAKAMRSGGLQLTLRNPRDETQTAMAEPKEKKEKMADALAEKPRDSLLSIEIIRGVTASTTTVREE